MSCAGRGALPVQFGVGVLVLLQVAQRNTPPTTTRPDPGGGVPKPREVKVLLIGRFMLIVSAGSNSAAASSSAF